MREAVRRRYRRGLFPISAAFARFTFSEAGAKEEINVVDVSQYPRSAKVIGRGRRTSIVGRRRIRRHTAYAALLHNYTPN